MGPTCFSLVFNVCESSFHCFHSTEECKNHGRSPCSDAKSIISTGCCPQLLYKPCSNYSSISYIFQTIQDLSCVMDDIYIYIYTYLPIIHHFFWSYLRQRGPHLPPRCRGSLGAAGCAAALRVAAGAPIGGPEAGRLSGRWWKLKILLTIVIDMVYRYHAI